MMNFKFFGIYKYAEVYTQPLNLDVSIISSIFNDPTHRSHLVTHTNTLIHTKHRVNTVFSDHSRHYFIPQAGVISAYSDTKFKHSYDNYMPCTEIFFLGVEDIRVAQKSWTH